VHSHWGVQQVKNARIESKFVDRDKKFNAEAMNVRSPLPKTLSPGLRLESRGQWKHEIRPIVLGSESERKVSL